MIPCDGLTTHSRGTAHADVSLRHRETVRLTLGRTIVSWRAEYRVVGYIRPGDREVRYVIRSTSRPSERIAREHEISGPG